MSVPTVPAVGVFAKELGLSNDQIRDQLRQHLVDGAGERALRDCLWRHQIPQGRPKMCQSASRSGHSTNSTATYGSINAMTVPTPAVGSYFIANATINPKYAFSGV